MSLGRLAEVYVAVDVRGREREAGGDKGAAFVGFGEEFGLPDGAGALAGKTLRLNDDGSIYFTTSNRDGRGSPARDDDRILRLVAVR